LTKEEGKEKKKKKKRAEQEKRDFAIFIESPSSENRRKKDMCPGEFADNAKWCLRKKERKGGKKKGAYRNT